VRRRLFLQRAMASPWALMGMATQASTGPPARVSVRARVVVVGGGFAGSACALMLRQIDPALLVSMIDPNEDYATGPMSNQVIVGERRLASIMLTRAGARRAGVQMVRDRVSAIDAERRVVTLGRGGKLRYDRLVLAPGIRFLTERVEGYDAGAALRMPHGWTNGAQVQLLARQLRAMRNGGVLAISVPAGLFRCPPGPYERASLIAHFLQRHKPRSKVLIFDANNQFPKQALFTAAWEELYAGLIEWIPPGQGGAISRVDPSTLTLFSSSGAHAVAVANVIPPQAPGQLAPDTGLASDHGWCPIEPLSFESTLRPGIHVIGDACIAGAMPKAGSAAVSQAEQCARAIVALLAGREAPTPRLTSVCYSAVAPGKTLHIGGQYQLLGGAIVSLPTMPYTFDAQQAIEARAWYRRIRTAAFGG